MGSKFRHILLSKAYRVYAMFVWWHQDESVWSWLHRLPVIVCGSWLYELSDSCMHLMRRGDRRRSRDMDREHLPTLRTTPSTIWPVFSHQRKGSRAAIEDRLVHSFHLRFSRTRRTRMPSSASSSK